MASYSDMPTRHGRLRLRDGGGEGLPVLMLHGSSGSMDVFAHQLEGALAARHRLLALDFPGHGGSEDAADPERSYGRVGLAEATIEVLDRLGIARVVVVGSSLGGHVGIEMMATTDRVAGLMVIGTPPVGHGLLGLIGAFNPHWDLLLASKPEFSVRDTERFERMIYGDSATPAVRAAIVRADGRARAVFFRSLLRGDGVDQRRAVQAASVPVALVLGAADQLVRQAYVAGIASPALFEGRMHVIEGAGHVPFLQTPERFDALLHRFVEHVRLREIAGERHVPPAARSA